MTVDRALRQLVLSRDRMCILANFDGTHRCVDRWGKMHSPTDIERLTIEHVREHPGGMRRDEPGWLVAMCHRSNELHAGSTTETRRLLNAYLLGVRNEEAML